MTEHQNSKTKAKMRNEVSQCGRRKDKGNILIVVSFVGLFTMALSGGLINHYAVSEARGVADSLAKLRVYWAMMGHIDYALSRMRQEHPTGAGWTSDVGENNIQGVLLSYLDELDYGPNRNCHGTIVKSTANSRCSVWLYDEISNDYTFHFKWTVSPTISSEGNPTDGRLAIRIEYVLEGEANNAATSLTSSVPSLVNLNKRVLDLEYTVCFVESDFPIIGNCTAVDPDVSGASRVIRVRRCKFNDGGSPGTFRGPDGSKVDNTETDTCI